MKRRPLAIIAALALLVPAFAGDVATFVNLGFSADSSFFMFAQYGVDPADAKPYAEIYLVDTKRNEFLPKGTFRKTFDKSLEAGQDSSGALFSLYAEALPLASSRKIDPLSPGRLIYALLDGEEPPVTLSFRDFKSGAAFEVSLQKSISESKDSVVSSFGLGVSWTGKDGAQKRVSGGNPQIKRNGVKDYVIRRIILAPDEKTLVLIIEKKMKDNGSSAIRYMVETIALP